jgi:hypothetical protein
MKLIYSIGLVLLVVGCQKEVKSNGQDTCNCYESHEMIETFYNGQTFTTTWQHQYNTTEAPDLCTKDTDTYVYYNNNNSRYKVECQ